MNIFLWIVQVLVALAFVGSGVPKAFLPIATLAKRAPWTAEMPALVRFIGVSEILGGIGLIVPAVTGILPWLTVAAALCLALVMVLVALFHARRGEYTRIAPSVVLLILVAIIAYGRWMVVPL